MKIMHKSAALAAALILTAGISVQANELTVTVKHEGWTTFTSTGTVSGKEIAGALDGQDLNVRNLTVGSLTVGGQSIDFGGLAGLEDQVDTNSNAIKALQSNFSNNQRYLGDLEKKVNTNTEAIGGLQNDVKTNSQNITGLQKQFGDLSTNYNNTKDVVTELYDKVSAPDGLESKVSQNTTQIGALDSQINGDNGLAEKVEVNGYKADAALKVEGNGVLYNHGTDLTTGINLNTSAIEQEEKDRVAADQNLQGQIDTNASNIGALDNQINGDNGLAEKVEVNGYKADAALKVEGNGVLYNHGTDLTTGINLNTSAIEQEEKDRVAADQNLQGQIDTNASNIGALDNQINGDNGLAEKVEVNGYKADTALKVEGNGVLYNHGTDLTTGINLNTSAIEQETKDRTAADQNLQNQITTNKEGIAANSNAISSLNSRVSDLGGEIDNVGAISAALAGLHPLDYDGTGSKFQLAAAMGDYDGSQAAAIGGFYHFNEDVMMSVGGATVFDGNKKTAFNVGVSFRVGSGSSAKRLNSDDVIAQLAAMNDKIAALEAENQKLTEKVAALQDSEAAPKA